MELTDLDVDLILYLHYRQENKFPAPTLLELADAKEDHSLVDIRESVNRLADLGYIRRIDGYPFPLLVLNDTRQLTPKARRKEYQEQRLVVLERDRRTCALCGGAGDCAHHIDYDHDNNDLGNMVTLCASCHGRVHGGDREGWRKRLVGLVIAV